MRWLAGPRAGTFSPCHTSARHTSSNLGPVIPFRDGGEGDKAILHLPQERVVARDPLLDPFEPLADRSFADYFPDIGAPIRLLRLEPQTS